MPLPRWDSDPTRRDPNYRFQDDRYTLGAHAMIYSTLVTGLWLFQLLYRADWPWLKPFVTGWTVLLTVNAVWVLAIARYPGLDPNKPDPTKIGTDDTDPSNTDPIKTD